MGVGGGERLLPFSEIHRRTALWGRYFGFLSSLGRHFCHLILESGMILGENLREIVLDCLSQTVLANEDT